MEYEVTAPGPDPEGRRQAYLGALGVPLWVSRQPLPGALAAEPVDCVPYAEAQPAPAADSAGPDSPAVDAPATPPAPVRAPAVPAAAPASAAARAAAPAQTDAPRLACRIQELAPGWSAVIDLGEAPDLSSQEHRLLANIAHALGGDTTAVPACEQLRWPLNRNPGLDHSARAMVEWLAHALRLPPGRCLVFGETLAGYVRMAQPQQSVLMAPRLAELLAEPAAKRELWWCLHD